MLTELNSQEMGSIQYPAGAGATDFVSGECTWVPWNLPTDISGHINVSAAARVADGTDVSMNNWWDRLKAHVGNTPGGNGNGAMISFTNLDGSCRFCYRRSLDHVTGESG